MATSTNREALKKKLKEVIAAQKPSATEAAPRDGGEAATGPVPAAAHSQAFVNIYGDNAKASIEVKKDNIRLNDVQQLLTWVLGDGISPTWAFVQNKPLVQQVVLVAIPALGFHTQLSQQEHMPFVMSTLGKPVQCRMDDGKASFQSSLERLLTIPATKSQKQQMKKQPHAPPKPPSQFALSLDKMRQLEYPMPELATDGSMHPPTGYTWTSEESFSDAGSPAVLHSSEEGAPRREGVEACNDLGASEKGQKKNGAATKSQEAEKKQQPDRKAEHGNQPAAEPQATAPAQDEMFALDCEMCYTDAGLEVTRATVVNGSGEPVLDELVLPDLPIKDYNTRYSGITAAMMADVTTRLPDIRDQISGLLKHHSFLVGHSLENDLRGLKLLHGRVLDTADLFPHPRGPPARLSLRVLAQQYLHRSIQSGSHDSVEDARAALELVKLKLKYGPDFGLPKSRTGPRQGIRLPAAISQRRHRTCFVDRHSQLQKLMTDNSSGVSVDTDEGAAQQCRKEARTRRPNGVPTNSLVFTRFVEMASLYGQELQNLKERCPQGSSEARRSPSPGCKKSRRKADQVHHSLAEVDIAPEVLRKVHGAVDNNLKTIWDSLGSNSMFVVVSLGGNTAYTRWLHEMRTKRQTGVAGWPAWSQACESYYLQQLDQSICGCAWANVKQ